MSKEFWNFVEKGVRQGCSLSPTLFNIYLADIEEELKKGRGGVKIGNDRVWSIEYADDIVLVSDREEGLRDMIRRCKKYMEGKKLEISIEKSMVMVFKNKGGKEKEILMVEKGQTGRDCEKDMENHELVERELLKQCGQIATLEECFVWLQRCDKCIEQLEELCHAKRSRLAVVYRQSAVAKITRLADAKTQLERCFVASTRVTTKDLLSGERSTPRLRML
ncbi:PREDICTED: uncharacterized protein LOC105153318 [Acromyrmex echinatior]|uniref:uncharacterized protein LOC105153318 n=1 Tax=Acromyrmex echinatior TaxID=103372 RepID=UPI000580EFAB|nr:PREDICTED: uncharacterized protein LOC105153318 [Acromyrmex echinatior]